MSEQNNRNKKITLFFLEDDREMLEHLYDIVECARHEMGEDFVSAWSATNLADTEYRLECDPGIAAFTHFLFDLDVGYYKTLRDSKVISYGDRTGFAGLDYILDAHENNPLFHDMMEAGRVAVFTGHSIDFLRKTDSTENDVYRCLKGRYFTKLGKNPSDEIMKWLKG